MLKCLNGVWRETSTAVFRLTQFSVVVVHVFTLPVRSVAVTDWSEVMCSC